MTSAIAKAATQAVLFDSAETAFAEGDALTFRPLPPIEGQKKAVEKTAALLLERGFTKRVVSFWCHASGHKRLARELDPRWVR